MHANVPHLPGYEIRGLIHENARVRIYRGCSSQDREPVVIKALVPETAGPNELPRLIHGYEIARHLGTAEGVVPHLALERQGSLTAVVMRDDGAVSLRELMREGVPFGADRFLPIAIGLASVLAEIHRRGVIHLDVHPGNILVSPDGRRVWLTDFGNAARLPAEGERASAPYPRPSGSPAYMSPEQTGRLGAALDMRSDLYSLGVVFYEMATGTLPFRGENAADWAYVHLTRPVRPPGEIAPGFPPVLSDIVMRLLGKDPEDRYQSALGLLKDLEECRSGWLETGTIEAFPLGKFDAGARFRLPDVFFGREREIRLLREAFERVTGGGTEAVFVSGESGVGKTSLIRESLKGLAETRMFFATGKADQLRSNIPYAPFAQAFGRLIRQMLTEDRDRLEQWKRALSVALGRNGAVLLGIVPELEWLIGPQPPAETLAPQEAEHRLRQVFTAFVSRLGRTDQPLVLFLDDLQWADDASIRLLEHLMRNIRHCRLLILGAFRDGELPEGHPLPGLAEDPRSTRIHLRGLDRNAAARLVAETLNVPPGLAAPLSDSLHHRSDGNPFFLRQLLALLHDGGSLRFDHREGRWTWDERAFGELHGTEDVLALIRLKLDRLPEDSRELIALASCLGNRFRLQALAALLGKSGEETEAALEPLIEEGLVTVAESGSDTRPGAVDGDRANVEMAFLHDHIQQAVYSLIDERGRMERHLRVGSWLLDGRSGGPLSERLLSMMDHFNRGMALVRDGRMRVRLARLNLLAGRRAKASAAYASALGYFRAGMELLPDEVWTSHRRLGFRLGLELAQAEFLCDETDKAEAHFDLLLRHARTELEWADVYGAKVILYAGVGRYREAVQAGRTALRELGFGLPLHPGNWDYVKELLRYKWLMRGRRIADLAELPEMRDPKRRKVMELSTRLSYVCMVSYPDLFGLIILRNGNYALRHGISEMSAAGFIGYGLTEGNILGNRGKGAEFGEFCVRLAEKYGGSAIRAIIYFVTGTLLSHWTQHVSRGLANLEKALEYGLEAGDVVIIGYARCMLIEHRYLAGAPLAELDGEIGRGRRLAERIRHDNLSANTNIYGCLVDALTGRTPDALEIGARTLERDEPLYAAQKDRTILATSWFARMTLYYLTDRPRRALEMADRLRPLRGTLNGLFITAELSFLHALAICAAYEQLSPRERIRRRLQLRRNRRLLRRWASSCGENFGHMALLIEAEMARLRVGEGEAMDLYDRAIESARRHGFFRHEALANALAAEYHLSLGRKRIADLYLREACRIWRGWGAHALARRLEERHPELTGEPEPGPEERPGTDIAAWKPVLPPAGDGPNGDPEWDEYFVDQALEVLATESDGTRLLERLLAIVLRSFGADRGCLVIEKNGDLYVEALMDATTGTAVVETVLLNRAPDLARSVIHYAARTSETVILNRGEPAGIFAGDPRLAESGPKSVACIPLLLQGVPFGVLYLENNQLSGLFDSRRLKVFRLLSSQIAFVKKVQALLDEDSARAGEGDEAEPSGSFEPFTDRELEVLRLMGGGLSNKEIGDRLEMSVNTVKTHIRNIYGKLGVSRRVQAVQKAKERRLL